MVPAESPPALTAGETQTRPASLPPGGTIVSVPIAEGSYGAGLYGSGPYGGGPIAGGSIAGSPIAGSAVIQGEVGLRADATVIRGAFDPDLSAEVLAIADDLRSVVPLLRQLIEAQSRLGSNSAASFARLGPDAPRIAELTAAALADEARFDSPRMHVVEQCLRVGRMLMQAAMEVIRDVMVAVEGILIYETLTDQEMAQAHARAIVSAIDHVLLALF
jgi:hypothetical protein